jgi:hypothetical protein
MTDFMKCGHTAQGTLPDGKPVCAICVGLDPGATEVEPNPPLLADRTAKCAYCPKSRPSSLMLAFFEYRAEHTLDRFYCGCRGWD